VGFSVSTPEPVFVTATTGRVRGLLTRSSPKSNDVPLSETDARAGAMVSAEVALWLRVPEVPVTVMLAVPAGAEEDTERLNSPSEPDVRFRLEGVAVTPSGREPSVTATFPLKSFVPEATTLSSCAAPPGATVMVDGPAWSEKSALVPLPLPPLPPPQPSITVKGTSRIPKAKDRSRMHSPKSIHGLPRQSKAEPSKLGEPVLRRWVFC